MSDDRVLAFYHSPHTRSSGVLALLEELDAPYELRIVNQKAGEQREAAFLAVNPMGKVPALLDGGALITEQVAIYIYLADRFPEKALAPGLDDADRGPYLRWMAFYGSAFEPAVVDRALQRDPGRAGMSPYGDFTTTLQVLEAQLDAGPFMLGGRFTAADVLWGTALAWVTGFGIVPKTPVLDAYIARVAARPAMARAAAQDHDLARSQVP